MPELPEVEHLCRSLRRLLPGRRVDAVTLRRPDVVRVSRPGGKPRRPAPVDLLRGCVVTEIRRHGKQLAISGESGRTLCVHLGMSGQLVCVSANGAAPRSDHVHLEWRLAPAEPDTPSRMLFRDPRRFGGVWAFQTFDELVAVRWSLLGPDALAITAPQLAAALARTDRALKAALLDQALIAGLGNIYVDEALFLARLTPRRPAASLSARETDRLCAAIHATLGRAIDAGGSSLRDYVDATGRPGGFQRLHAVYGRAGLPCTSCGMALESAPVAQRTTVWCSRCQR